MNTIGTWAGRTASVAALSTAAMLGFAGLAHADLITDSIDTIETPNADVKLVAGSGAAGTATIVVTGEGNDGDNGCNWRKGESPLVLDVRTPVGVVATPDPLTITNCDTPVTISFTASAVAQSGPVTVSITSQPEGGGTYHNQVSIPITVAQPVPANTAPSVAVKGVADGAAYEIGAVPTATCAATDTEDGPSSPAPVVTGTLSHGLGTQTVSCETTDSGELKATASASYTIVDTRTPTITHALTPANPNSAGWYDRDVTVDFSCEDSGSGIESCTGDTTLTEGANQSVKGTATDWAGNTAEDTVSGINIDRTAPTGVQFTGGPAAGSAHYYGDVPAAPADCTATDPLSGVASCTVTGGGTAVGAHTYTATATDKAGNTSTATLAYTVKPFETKGFYAPVDMSGVWNAVKGGSTVPLKFEVFAGTAEKTDTAVVKSFTTKAVTCPGSTAPVDEIELTTTGGTALRYDTAGGQFVQNWQTPKKPGTCAQTTVTTQDGSTITANFMFK